MSMPVTIPEKPIREPGSLWSRVGWFVGLYLLGVGSVGLMAYGLRLWIKH